MLHKKVIFLFMSISSLIVYANNTHHRRDPSLEMQTIFDHENPSKLDPILLEKDAFTRATLREIILQTHEIKQLPQNTNDVFNTLLEYNFNFIQLGKFLDSKVDSFCKDDQSKEKTKDLLLTAFRIACNTQNLKHSQKQALDASGNLARLKVRLDQLQSVKSSQ